ALVYQRQALTSVIDHGSPRSRALGAEAHPAAGLPRPAWFLPRDLSRVPLQGGRRPRRLRARQPFALRARDLARPALPIAPGASKAGPRRERADLRRDGRYSPRITDVRALAGALPRLRRAPPALHPRRVRARFLRHE